MDLKGKTVVVTGATSGLGQAVAIDFAKQGARVFIVGRDAARAKETQAQAGGETEIVIGDVSTKAGVKALAQAILAKTQKVDVLLNNAGGQFKSMSKTADGNETTFALNTLGAFWLERELHDAVKAAKGRVVNVVTGLLDLGQFKVDADQINGPAKYSSLAQYGRSKHASIMMTVEQAKRYAADGITYVAIHPGVILGTRFNGGTPALAQAIAGPIMRAIGFACTLEEAVRRFDVACFSDVPNGSYMQKGKVTPLTKQAAQEPERARVMALIDRLAA